MGANNSENLSRIKLRQWRQFDEIDIEFHPRLTVLTGANGTGKSTILSILESNLIGGERGNYLATPVENESKKETRYSVSTIFQRFNPFRKSPNEAVEQFEPQQIGSVVFNGFETCNLSLPPPQKIEYTLMFSRHPELAGFKIGSHRPVPKYQSVRDIPVAGIKPMEAFEYFKQSWSNYEVSQVLRRGSSHIKNPISPLKQTLISFAMHGSNNKNVRAVPEIVGLFDEFQSTLKNILPKEIRFKRLQVSPPEVLVITETGDFPIDGSSGGLMSLIQTSWQIFLFTHANKGPCVVLIDEPENHLHPSLQREYLSLIVNAFRSVQFVVVTHSPFIISSVKDCVVYALRFKQLLNEDDVQSGPHAVISERIDLNNNAVTAAEILDEVLGVSVTMPVWAEQKLRDIVDNFNKDSLDEMAMEKMRADLRVEGLGDFLPQAITRLLK
ncbi:MAG: AAA family ATPase [Maricaulaceae bacterium]